MAVVVAGRRIEVNPGMYTWLETIHGSNVSRRKVMLNTFYSEVFFRKSRGKFKPVPDELVKARVLYTGTFGMIGDKGKPLGKEIASQCDYKGSRKTVIVRPVKDLISRVDTLVTCDHGFAPDGTPFLQLSDASTGNEIRSEEDMQKAREVLLTLRGQIFTFKIQNRGAEGREFESVGDEKMYIYISESAVVGLLSHDTTDELSFFSPRESSLFNQPVSCIHVAREAE